LIYFLREQIFVIQTQNSVSVRHPSGNPRLPKEWFNLVVNKYIPELANRLAQISADAVVNAARLRIVRYCYCTMIFSVLVFVSDEILKK
jgi:hypothetical protein